MKAPQKIKGKKLRLRDLTYERFIETTDRFAVALILRAKHRFPTANDPAFAQDFLLSGIRLNMYEPPDGPAKQALDVFDISYKLGLPIAGTLISILRHSIRAWWHRRTYMPKFTRKYIFRKWKFIPLPWLDHIELYEDNKLTARRYTKRGSINDIGVNSSRLYGSYEGSFLQYSRLRFIHSGTT